MRPDDRETWSYGELGAPTASPRNISDSDIYPPGNISLGKYVCDFASRQRVKRGKKKKKKKKLSGMGGGMAVACSHTHLPANVATRREG